jgi:serine/threonine protein kinase
MQRATLRTFVGDIKLRLEGEKGVIHMKQLNSGAYGSIYVATCINTGTQAIVKILGREAYKIEERWEVLSQNELQISQSMSHRNICPTFATFAVGHKLVMVMEYASGGDLCDMIMNLPSQGLCESEAKPIFAKVVAGVRYMHERGFLHRDIKPENVLIASDGRIMLCDFGFSHAWKSNESVSRVYRSVGTPLYASPEIFLNMGAEATPAADVWSLGCLLYALLMGHALFDHGDDVMATARSIIAADYEMPSNLSLDASDLIARMVRADAHRRISIDEILQHPWLSTREK